MLPIGIAGAIMSTPEKTLYSSFDLSEKRWARSAALNALGLLAKGRRRVRPRATQRSQGRDSARPNPVAPSKHLTDHSKLRHLAEAEWQKEVSFAGGLGDSAEDMAGPEHRSHCSSADGNSVP